MFELVTYKLKDIASVQTGPFGSQLHQSDYQTLGTPIITVEHLGENKILHQNLPLVSDEDKNRLNKYLLQEGDIVFSRVGSVDRRAYVSAAEDGWMFSGRCLRVRINRRQANPKYISYYFGQAIFKEHIRRIAVGATMPSINTDILSNVEIHLPSNKSQDQIAELLTCLDDKIILLLQQNQTLEALAEALFQHWFVEGNRNKCNSAKTLSQYVASANTGLDAIKRAPIVEEETGIKCLRIQDVSQSKPIERWGNTKVEENNFKKFQLIRDDIIMARTCSPGINLFIRENLPAVFNNGLVRIRADKEKVFPILLKYLFKTREFVGHIDGISGGTSVQLNMQVGDLLSYQFQFPSIEKQSEVIEHFNCMDYKITFNNSQIKTLTQLRDTLLPKLMTGEVRVESVQEETELV